MKKLLFVFAVLSFVAVVIDGDDASNGATPVPSTERVAGNDVQTSTIKKMDAEERGDTGRNIGGFAQTEPKSDDGNGC